MTDVAEEYRLTEAEQRICEMLTDTWNAMVEVGLGDQEAVAHIHALQRAVMAQVARRVHPDIFRSKGVWRDV